MFLLVEDDDDHAMLIERAMRRVPEQLTITRVADGEAALKFLRREPPYEDSRRPDVILLDLNLPKYSGHEVLRAAKSDERLAEIPVVVLTTSDADIDRSQAYQNRVNSFLVKPVDFEQFRTLVADLSRYWGHWNEPSTGAENAATKAGNSAQDGDAAPGTSP